MRGTHLLSAPGPGNGRFIPACAGNTFPDISHNSRPAVHPRVCGEHNNEGYDFSRQPGSSPRVRGTLSLCQNVIPVSRFIPACAGNTVSGQRSNVGNAVHPRVCGEHFEAGAASGFYPGSSPRVRGTHRSRRCRRGRGRFIPACAGNTT